MRAATRGVPGARGAPVARGVPVAREEGSLRESRLPLQARLVPPLEQEWPSRGVRSPLELVRH